MLYPDSEQNRTHNPKAENNVTVKCANGPCYGYDANGYDGWMDGWMECQCAMKF